MTGVWAESQSFVVGLQLNECARERATIWQIDEINKRFQFQGGQRFLYTLHRKSYTVNKSTQDCLHLSQINKRNSIRKTFNSLQAKSRHGRSLGM